MSPETLLTIGFFVCVLGVVAAIVIAIKYRDEDWGFLPIIAALMLGGGAAACLQDAVKRSEARERGESGVPVDARPAK